MNTSAKQVLRTLSIFTAFIVASVFVCAHLYAADKGHSAEPEIYRDGESLVVMVEAHSKSGASQIGAGVVVGSRRPGTIYVATAQHLIWTDLEAPSIVTVRFREAPNRSMSAKVVVPSFEKSLDLALLEVQLPLGFGDWYKDKALPHAQLSKVPKAGDAAFLVGQSAGKSWSRSPVPNSIGGQTAKSEILVVSDTGGPGLSGGAALDSSGRIFGIPVKASGRLIHVLLLSVAVDQISKAGYPVSIVQGPELREQLSVDSSLERLDRAKELRDGSDLGQGEALEVLANTGHKFTGQNLTGLNLDSVNVRTGVFDSADLSVSTMADAKFIGGAFTGATMKFATAENVDLSEADLSGVYAPLFAAPKGVFSGAKLSGSNFYGANFRGASFGGADLSGASLAFADLRDADLRGANLEKTQLVGAVLEGAKFTDAKFSNTNLLGAVLNPNSLSAEQNAGACRVALGGGRRESNRVKIVVASPNSKFKSGYAYEELDAYGRVGPSPKAIDDTSLPICVDDRERFNGFVPWSPLGMSTQLHSRLLTPLPRRRFLLQAVEQFYSRLEEGYAAGDIYRGNGRQVKDWIQEMRISSIVSTAKNVSPVASPDYVLAILIARGVLSESNVDWGAAAENRHRNERKIFREQRGDFAKHLAFPRLYPTGSLFEDLPVESVDLYRSWLIAHSKLISDRIDFLLPSQVVFGMDYFDARSPMSNREAKSLGLEFKEQPPKTSRLQISPYAISRNALGSSISDSWSSAASTVIEGLRGSLDSAAHVPVKMHSIGVGEVIFLFPKPLHSYSFDLPLPVTIEQDSRWSPDLRALATFEAVERIDRGRSSVFTITLNNLSAELFIDNKPVARGKLVSR